MPISHPRQGSLPLSTDECVSTDECELHAKRMGSVLCIFAVAPSEAACFTPSVTPHHNHEATATTTTPPSVQSPTVGQSTKRPSCFIWLQWTVTSSSRAHQKEISLSSFSLFSESKHESGGVYWLLLERSQEDNNPWYSRTKATGALKAHLSSDLKLTLEVKGICARSGLSKNRKPHTKQEKGKTRGQNKVKKKTRNDRRKRTLEESRRCRI